MDAERTLLSPDQQRAWLVYAHCPRMGIVSFKKLISLIPNPLQLLQLPREQLIHYGLTPAQINYLLNPDWQLIDQQFSFLQRYNINIIPFGSVYYPRYLAQTARPPLLLFVKGNYNLLDSWQIAFVGSRNPSAYGKQVTQQLIADLAPLNMTITSGLAVGIDGVAHQSALNNGAATIAVMGAGHRHIYPKRHQYLADQIVESGCLISEFSPDTPPIQHNFPRRNRIIAGLSKGTVVIEAAIKSGSLITAKYALDEGREVFAVPGNIFNPLSQGGHHLIQQGAKLVTNAADIVEEYANLFVSEVSELKKDLAGGKLLASVDHDATAVDVIAQRAGLPVSQVLTELLELELQGSVVAVPGGYIRAV